MSNIVKWELRKQMYRSRWIMVSIVTILLMMLITTAMFPVNHDVILVFEVLLVFGIVWPLVTSILNLVSDLQGPTYLLERSTARNHLPVFLTQIGCNVIYFLLATLVANAGEVILSQFNTDNMSYFSVGISRPYLILMQEFTFIYPIGIMFAYLVGAQFSQSKLIRGFMMLVAGILLYQGSSLVQGNEAIFFVVALFAGIGMLFASNKLIKKT